VLNALGWRFEITGDALANSLFIDDSVKFAVLLIIQLSGSFDAPVKVV
jgi:hypothetical protein